MSLLDQIYATPNRVQAVVRLLHAAPKHEMGREEAEQLLSPDSLVLRDGQIASNPRAMIKAVVRECVALRLVEERKSTLRLARDLAQRLASGEDLSICLQSLIFACISAENDDTNEDLALALAWHLGQRVLHAPETWTEFQTALAGNEVRAVLQVTNDNRHQMLVYWSVYLGFGRIVSVADDRVGLSPDPTEAIRRMLPMLLPPRKARPIRDFILELGIACPVLDGGRFRGRVENCVPAIDNGFISQTTSHALLLLQDLGELRLMHKSDATLLVVSDGQERLSVSEISRVSRGVKE